MTDVVGEAVVELRADLDRLRKDVDRQGKDAGNRFGSGFDKGARKHFAAIGDSFKTAGVAVGSILTVAGAAGPAVIALGGALSAAASGAVALGGALGPAVVGGIAAYAGVMAAAAQGTAVFKLATTGLGAALAGQEGAMKALTPPAREFAKTLQGLRPQYEGLQRVAARTLFAGLGPVVNRLARSYFPLLRTAVGQTGTALNGIAVSGARLAQSGPFRRDFATATKANAVNLGLMGRVALSLADAARSLYVASLPLIRTFLRWAASAAATVDSMVQAGRASGALQAFFRNAATTGAQLGNILGNVAVGLFNIFRIGGAGAGKSMLTTLQSITAEFRAWTASDSGITKISAYFKQGQATLGALGRLIGSVTSGLSSLGSGAQLAPLIDQITNQVIPPLTEFLQNASASGALSSLISAVGQLLGVFASLSSVDSSLKAFSTTLGALASGAQFILQNVPGATQALGAFFIVLGARQAAGLVGLGGLINAVGAGLVALGARFLAAAGFADAETGAVTLNSIAHRISASTIGTWIGVKALEAAAWLRALPATIASTAAMLANRAVYGVSYLTTFVAAKALEFAAWVRTTAAATASVAGLVASRVAMIAAGAAARVFAAGQFLLNAAMTANPIGLVVVAIAALVGAFVLAYTHSARFRAIVQGALRGVAAAGQFMWNNVLKPALAGLVGGFKAVVAGARFLAQRGSAFLHALGAAGRALWNNFIAPAFRSILRGVATVIQGFANMARAGGHLPGPLGAAFRKIGGALQGAADKARNMANGIRNIPTHHSTKIEVNGLSQAIHQTDTLAGAIARLHDKRVTIFYTAHQPTINKPHEHASGTLNAPGGWSWVGEQGPELLRLPAGSQVMPRNTSADFANKNAGVDSGSGRAAPIFHIYPPTNDVQALAMQVSNRLVLDGTFG